MSTDELDDPEWLPEVKQESSVLKAMLTRPSRYQCRLCQFKTSKRSAFCSHLKRHTGCTVTDDETINKYTVLNDQLLKASANSATVIGSEGIKSVCQQRDTRENNRSEINSDMILTVSGGYQCKLCDFVTGNKGEVNSHVKVHSEQRMYCCRICGWTSCAIQELLVHKAKGCFPSLKQVESLQIQRDVTSPESESRVVAKQKLKKEVTVETRQSAEHTQSEGNQAGKVYICRHCKYATYRRPCFRRHLKQHVGRVLYGKEVEEYSLDPSSLPNNEIKVQIMDYSNVKKASFECSLCDFKRTYRYMVRTHLRKHFDTDVIKCCRVCNAAETKELLLSHWKSSHPKDYETATTKSNRTFCGGVEMKKGKENNNLIKSTGKTDDANTNILSEVNTPVKQSEDFSNREELDEGGRDKAMSLPTLERRIYQSSDGKFHCPICIHVTCYRSNMYRHVKSHFKKDEEDIPASYFTLLDSLILYTEEDYKSTLPLQASVESCESSSNEHKETTDDQNNESETGNGGLRKPDKEGVGANKKLECKLFACSICKYSTIIRSHFQRHLKQHLGRVPRGNELHRYIVDPEKVQKKDSEEAKKIMYHCKLCDFKRSYRYFIRFHLEKHFNTDVIKNCQACKAARSQNLLLLHWKMNHPEDFKVLNAKMDIMLDDDVAAETSKENNEQDSSLATVDLKVNSIKCELNNGDSLEMDKEKMWHQLERKIFQSPQDGKFHCPLCPQTCGLRSNIVRHVKLHLQKREQADVPDSYFLLLESLILAVEHSSVYTCHYCDFTTPFRSDLKAHEISHPESGTQKCSVCGHQFLSTFTLERHMSRNHKGLVKFECRYCSKTFLKLGYKRNHERVHILNKTRPVECDECGKRFPTAVLLRTHKKFKHSKGYEFKCPVCSKGCHTRSLLLQHVNRHTNKRRFVCETCGKSYACHSTLSTHLLQHKEKQLQCKQCGKKFRYHFMLATHRRTHTGELPYACTFCNRRFLVSETLKKHLTTHTGIYPHNCDSCKRGFYQRKRYADHMLKLHKIIVKPTDKKRKLEYPEELQSKVLKSIHELEKESCVKSPKERSCRQDDEDGKALAVSEECTTNSVEDAETFEGKTDLIIESVVDNVEYWQLELEDVVSSSEVNEQVKNIEQNDTNEVNKNFDSIAMEMNM